MTDKTMRELFEEATRRHPGRFREAPRTGKAVVIGGARPANGEPRRESGAEEPPPKP